MDYKKEHIRLLHEKETWLFLAKGLTREHQQSVKNELLRKVDNIQYQLDELEGACDYWMPSKGTSGTRCSNCGKDRWEHDL